MRIFIILMCFLATAFSYTIEVKDRKDGKTQTITCSSGNADDKACTQQLEIKKVSAFDITIKDLKVGNSFIIKNNNQQVQLKITLDLSSQVVSNANNSSADKNNLWRVVYGADPIGGDKKFFQACAVAGDATATYYPVNQSFYIAAGATAKVILSTDKYKFDCSGKVAFTDNKDAPTINLTEVSLSVNNVSDDEVDPYVDPQSGSLIYPTIIIDDDNWLNQKIPIKGFLPGGNRNTKDLCEDANITKIVLYDNSGEIGEMTQIHSADPYATHQDGTYYFPNTEYINIKVPSGDINYRKMHLEVECSPNTIGKDKFTRKIYFDARPKLIYNYGMSFDYDTFKWKPTNMVGEELYAEYEYGIKDNSINTDLSHLVEKTCQDKCLQMVAANYVDVPTKLKDNQAKIKECLKCLKDSDKPLKLSYFASKDNNNKFIDFDSGGQRQNNYINKNMDLRAIDGSSNIGVVKSYNATLDLIIVNKLLANTGSPVNCLASKQCKKAYIDIKEGQSQLADTRGVYMLRGDEKYLRYDEVGPTMIFGSDTKWTAFSQHHVACQRNSTTNTPNASGLIGCNIPLSNVAAKYDLYTAGRVMEAMEQGIDKGINFYTFKPAVMKVKVDLKNSPKTNNPYSSDKFTYIRDIKNTDKDLDFEMAEFNVSVLAIGASKNSFEHDVALKNYGRANGTTKFKEYASCNNLGICNYDEIKFLKDDNTGIAFEYTGGREVDNAMNIKVDLKGDNDFFRLRNLQNDSGTTIFVKKNIATGDPIFLPDGNEGKVTKKGNDYIMNFDKNANDFIQGKASVGYLVNSERNNLLASNYEHIGNKFGTTDAYTLSLVEPENDFWKEHAQRGISIAFDVDGRIDLVDAAIIAPDFSHNNKKADAAVYLGVYCTNCPSSGTGILSSSRVPDHIKYFGLSENVFNTQLFNYDQNVIFGLHNDTGADYLTNLPASGEVSVMLKNNPDLATQDALKQSEQYCKIFRNCRKLRDGVYGTTFKVISKTQQGEWHGKGDKGETVLQNKERRQANSRIEW